MDGGWRLRHQGEVVADLVVTDRDFPWNFATGTRTVLLFGFLRPGRTMDEVDEMPPEVAAALRRRARDQQ